MRRKREPARLRDMNQERALAYCANLTASEWSGMDDDHIIELWRVFRSYILNGFQETDMPIPNDIREVWSRCKIIIDGEARK